MAAAALLAAALVAAAVIVVGGSGQDRRLAPAAGTSGDHYDPLAYDAGRRTDFERRAAAGLAPVLYDKSPGGVVASARRTARFRPLIERAAKAGGIDPNLLEGIVMLESAGRADIIAGNDPTAASGLTQVLAGTATDLLGMRVDLRASKKLTKRIARADARGNAKLGVRLRAQRRRIDDRFDPARELAGTVRYLTLARKRFGREDLAIASYHMGIGNLETVLRLFAGADASKPIAQVAADNGLDYAHVYFDSTPLLHPLAYHKLAAFGDDSSTYLWRVLAAREIMRLYRSGQLRDGAGLRTSTGSLVQPPPRTGSLGLGFSAPSGDARRLRPEAMSALLYIAVGTRDISGGCCLDVTRAGAPGYAFDISRHYRDHGQALAFQFMLDRLAALDLIRWQRSGDQIHVVVGADAARLLPGPGALARDALRARPKP